MIPALLFYIPAQNDYTFAERFIPSQNFSSENLHPVSKLSAFAKYREIAFKVISRYFFVSVKHSDG